MARKQSSLKDAKARCDDAGITGHPPLELNGIAISHHSDEDFSQRQVVETSKSLASGTFHSKNGRLERWPRELQPWPGKSHSL